MASHYVCICIISCFCYHDIHTLYISYFCWCEPASAFYATVLCNIFWYVVVDWQFVKIRKITYFFLLIAYVCTDYLLFWENGAKIQNRFVNFIRKIASAIHSHFWIIFILHCGCAVRILYMCAFNNEMDTALNQDYWQFVCSLLIIYGYLAGKNMQIQSYPIFYNEIVIEIYY